MPIEIIHNRSVQENHFSEISHLISHSEKMILCAGWVNIEGLILLSASLNTALNNNADITLITYSDKKKKHTSLKCLAFFKKWNLRHVPVTNKGVEFHTKLYYFISGKNFTAIIGSANITEGSLTNRDELSVKITGEIGDSEHCKIVSYLDWLSEKYGI